MSTIKLGAVRKKPVRNLERNITHILFVLPNFLLYSFLSVMPIIIGIYYSFTDWNGITKKFNFIGVKNYLTMFNDPRFIRAIWFNLRYALLLIVCIVVVSTCLALLLNTQIRARSIFRTIYFFPAVVSMLTVSLIFNEIFYRAVPALGTVLGIEALQTNILGTGMAMYGVLIVHVWQGAAIPTVLLLAGLQTIPAEIIESSYLDGASKWQQFRFITIPFILPIISIILVLVFKDGLMIYDYIVGLTNGGPAGATESITLLLYRQGFEELKFSYSIAQSIVVSLIILTISVLQIEHINKRKVYQ